MKFFNSIIKLSLVSTFVLVTNVNAATTTWEWNLSPGQGDCSSNCSSINVSDTENSQTITANISGFADTTGNGDLDLEAGKLNYYSGGGWGLVNKDENGSGSQHTFDNLGSYVDSRGQQSSSTADYDMALVSFDTSVALTAINFGYIQTDGDFTVLAFDMSKDFSNTPKTTWASVAGSGDWITVGNYDANSTGYYSINNSNTTSQYWLIGAYNSVFTGALETNGSLDLGNDKFKIKKLKAETSSTPPPAEEVPAPAAFGLLLVGALGIYARRNKYAA